MSTFENLKGIPLLGGYNADELWPTVNLALVSWALLVFAPRWRHTPTLTMIAPIIHAVMYTLATTNELTTPKGDNDAPIDMSTLAGVVALFQEPTGVFIGWLHYLVYDVLVGRWIALDSVARGASVPVHALVVAPLLIVSLLFGPAGWLLYVAIVRPFLLPVTAELKSKKTK